jgi:rod shape determining protein RodA
MALWGRFGKQNGGIGERVHASFTRVGDGGQLNRMSRQELIERIFVAQLLPAMGLALFGLVVIWSASLSIADASLPRHLVGIVLGLVAAYAIWRYDYRRLATHAGPLLLAAALLMILPRVPGFGYAAKGITGWVRLPLIGLRFQPSEPAKLAVILLMASLCAGYNGVIEELRDYLRLCGVLAVPFLLILTQPDLGTGLIVVVAGATIIVCSGARRSWVLVTICVVVLGAALVVVTSLMPGMPHILKQYQLNRLIVFVDPSVDPTGDGYNLQQAKIAVGSGGLFGKGVGNASQSASGFLPEAHTDFVFALLAEEFGFVGTTLLLSLYAWLLLSSVAMAQRVESPFGKLILVGVVSMWAFQLLQEVGMCIGLMPITGIPLPFVSFGSSSMITQLAAVGLSQSVWRHRSKIG